MAAALPQASARAQAPVAVEDRQATDTSLSVRVSATQVRRVLVESPEVLVLFARPIAPGQLEAFAQRRAGWIETVEYGYDSLVVRFLPDVAVTAEVLDNAVEIRASRVDSTASAVTPGEAGVDPQLVRLEYYRALTLMETGAVRQGRALLVEQNRVDPRNVEVLLLLAQAEERLGRADHAIALLDRALELDPGNPQAVQDKARLHYEAADHAGLSVRFQDVENADSQRIAVLDGRFGIVPGVGFEYRLEDRHLQVDEARRADGGLAAFDGSRQFGTFRLARPEGGAVGIGATLFTANDRVGFGVDLSTSLGAVDWKLVAAFNEPETDYIEGLIEGAGRDRLGITVSDPTGDSLQLQGGVAVNRYTIGDDHAASGLELTGEIRYPVYAPWPYVTVGYRLDAEYFNGAASRTAADGTQFEPLPLTSREAHTLDAGAEGFVTDYLRARAFGGFTVDRLNGSGPSMEFELVYEPLPDLEVTAGMGTSLAVTRGTQSQLIFGGLSVRTRF